MPTRLAAFLVRSLPVIAGGVLAAAAAASPPAGFYVVAPIRPIFTGSEVLAVSSDGDTAVGIYRSAGGYVGMRWTIAGGEELGNRDLLTSVSADGSMYAGSHDGFRRLGYYYSPATGGVEIGSLPTGSPPNSNIYGLSSDGLFAVGSSNNTLGYGAIAWTPEGGMVELPNLAVTRSRAAAADVTDDHAHIVGSCENEEGGMRAVVWHRDGEGYTIQVLRGLEEGYDSGVAFGVSGDGSVIVGYSVPPFPMHAARWDADGTAHPLGDFLGGRDESQAFATTDDGLVIVGEGSDAEGKRAFVWSPGYGIQYLTTALSMAGVVVPDGWELQRANDVSADGRTIVGVARDPSGDTMGFIAVLPTRPCGGDVNWDGHVDFLDFLAFLNYYARRDLAVDYTHDGLIDYPDYLEFLNVFEAGCPD